jgi:hypothetical protein
MEGVSSATGTICPNPRYQQATNHGAASGAFCFTIRIEDAVSASRTIHILSSQLAHPAAITTKMTWE